MSKTKIMDGLFRAKRVLADYGLMGSVDSVECAIDHIAHAYDVEQKHFKKLSRLTKERDELRAQLAADQLQADISYCDGWQAGYQSLSGIPSESHNPNHKIHPDDAARIKKAAATWKTVQQRRAETRRELLASHKEQSDGK